MPILYMSLFFISPLEVAMMILCPNLALAGVFLGRKFAAVDFSETFLLYLASLTQEILTINNLIKKKKFHEMVMYFNETMREPIISCLLVWELYCFVFFTLRNILDVTKVWHKENFLPGMVI